MIFTSICIALGHNSFFKFNSLICPLFYTTRHLGLLQTRNQDPSTEKISPIPEFTYDDDYSQTPQYDYWFQ